ncbi:D-amino-acid N-acetyltransferase [Neophaeococcomyces mojaviensis]|uniref:D-amino-acid N-acetyltransferase n=1 Tax=Neophaeococcomyces mojaviensis TaxID=3383035 RepID=A0ACC3AJE9_9EURO|nr:D-amino-acid N-acetyltransferase [Knufia sp. JES_112]
MSVQVRSMETADKDAWLALWAQYNEFYKRTIPTEVTDVTFSRFLDDSVRMYGAVAVDKSDNNKVIGFVHWYPHQSTSSINEVVYLHDLFVDPNVRNKGSGRMLIEHVYEHAKSIPASSVYWHTQYFNHRAQLLYTKVAQRTDFVHYQKTL